MQWDTSARRFAAALALALLLLVKESPLRAQDLFPPDEDPPVTVAEIEEALSPYGEWLELPPWGRVWQPNVEEVGEDFVPYLSNGRWLAGPTGWTFDSGFPWGWAAFHFGRWMSVPQRGWVWTEEGVAPEPVWGGAWVVWRTGGALVGWYPAPPAGAHRDDTLWSVVSLKNFQSREMSAHTLNPPPQRQWSAAAPPASGPPVGPLPSWRGFPRARAVETGAPSTNNSFLLAVPSTADPGALLWSGWGASVHAPMDLGRHAGASPLSTGPGSSVFATPGLGISPGVGTAVAPRRLGGAPVRTRSR